MTYQLAAAAGAVPGGWQDTVPGHHCGVPGEWCLVVEDDWTASYRFWSDDPAALLRPSGPLGWQRLTEEMAANKQRKLIDVRCGAWDRDKPCAQLVARVWATPVDPSWCPNHWSNTTTDGSPTACRSYPLHPGWSPCFSGRAADDTIPVSSTHQPFVNKPPPPFELGGPSRRSSGSTPSAVQIGSVL